jgi:hypothetical protein
MPEKDSDCLSDRERRRLVCAPRVTARPLGPALSPHQISTTFRSAVSQGAEACRQPGTAGRWPPDGAAVPVGAQRIRVCSSPDGFLVDSWWNRWCQLRSDPISQLPEDLTVTYESAFLSTPTAAPDGDGAAVPTVASGPAAGRRPLWPSPFQQIALQFADLDVTGSCDVDGTQLAGLHDRLITIAEFRTLLLHPSTAYPIRNAALDWLIARAAAGDNDWTLALTGILLPGLRAALKPLLRQHPHLRSDIETAALTALWLEAHRLPPGRGKVAGRLLGTARRAATRQVRTETDHSRQTTDPMTLPDDGNHFLASSPSGPAGHPDFVLARAVVAGVLLADDADLIGVTRLETIPLEVAANQLGISYGAAAKRRARAETQLAGWIRRQQTDADTPTAAVAGGIVQIRPVASPCSSGGRPRQGRRPDLRSGAHQPTATTPRR